VSPAECWVRSRRDLPRRLQRGGWPRRFFLWSFSGNMCGRKHNNIKAISADRQKQQEVSPTRAAERSALESISDTKGLRGRSLATGGAAFLPGAVAGEYLSPGCRLRPSAIRLRFPPSFAEDMRGSGCPAPDGSGGAATPNAVGAYSWHRAGRGRWPLSKPLGFKSSEQFSVPATRRPIATLMNIGRGALFRGSMARHC